MPWKRAAALWVLALLIAGALGWRGANTGGSQNLVARLVLPAQTSDGVVDARPSEAVDIAWEITNAGNTAVVGIAVNSSCKCTVSDPFPDTLLPQQSAILKTKLRAPPAGTVTRFVPINSGAASEVILQVSVPIRSKVETPSWLGSPTGADLTFVEGVGTARDVTWESIELIAEQPWIDGIRIEPEGLADCAFVVQDHEHGEDGRYRRREYRLTVIPHTAIRGVTDGRILFDVSPSRPPAEPVPFRMELVPAISVFPDHVALHPSGSADSKSAVRVSVVNRQEEPMPLRLKYNESLLDVEEVGDPSARTRLFDIRIRPTANLSDTTGETEIEFSSDNVQSARLSISLRTE